VREYCLATVKHDIQLLADGFAPLLVGHIRKPVEIGHRGVVVQNIDAAIILDGKLDQTVDIATN